MARRFERDHGRASHAGPRRGRRGRDGGGGEVVGAPGDARRLALITAAMVVAFDLAHGLSALHLEAGVATDLIVGSAVKHPHALSLGRYSVHTSPAALRVGEAGIVRLGRELRAQGIL